MNRLKNARIYVAGNIDGLADGGNSWRDEITPFLKSMNMVVMNPCKKPTNLIRAMLSENAEFRASKKQIKESGNYDALKALMKPIAYADLALVDRADVLLVGLDMDNRACGTIWEVCVANLARKPIIVVCSQGKSQTPDWLFALLKHELFFDTFEEAKTYLKHIDSAEHIDDLNGRWKLFDFESN